MDKSNKLISFGIMLFLIVYIWPYIHNFSSRHIHVIQIFFFYFRFCVGDKFYLCDNKILCEYDYEERMVFANMPFNYNALTQIKRQTQSLSDDLSSGYGSPSPGSLWTMGYNDMYRFYHMWCLPLAAGQSSGIISIIQMIDSPNFSSLL